jgi:ketosteroid isomerase-like protein
MPPAGSGTTTWRAWSRPNANCTAGIGGSTVSIRDVSNKVTLEVSDDMKLHRYGDTVVVTGATHEKGKQNGKPYEHYGRFTDTWVKHNDEWICVASHLGLLQK